MARTKTTSNMIRINLYITEKQDKILHAMAARKGVSFSEMMRTVLDKALAGKRA